MIAPGSLTAIVPAKAFGRAKSRLSSALSPEARRALASSMLDHVLVALARSAARPRVIVVTDGDDVAEASRRRGASPLLESGGSGLWGAVEAGLQAAGPGPSLVLMADLPCLVPADVDALVSALTTADVALAPDGRLENTNGLALAEGARIATFFGTGSSLGKHIASAERSGRRAALVSRPGLLLDVDDGGDLASALAAGAPALGQLSGVPQSR